MVKTKKKASKLRLKKTKSVKAAKACFGAGCFWGVQYVFDKFPGVLKTEVGYMGGTVKDPSYELVCTGVTGHAEVVYIEFDPKRVNYEKLLEIFWKCHDPTQMNRQGPDFGKQYRSVIFYYNSKQKAAAEKSKKAYQKELGKEIVTAIEPASDFWRAEEYHQKYYEKKGSLPYCHVVPKVKV